MLNPGHEIAHTGILNLFESIELPPSGAVRAWIHLDASIATRG